jgi:AcrR family transcriptional regulator
MTHPQRHRGTGDREPKAALGRPRDGDVDTRIIAATRSLLAEVGYNRLSFEMLAQASGVRSDSAGLARGNRRHG